MKQLNQCLVLLQKKLIKSVRLFLNWVKEKRSNDNVEKNLVVMFDEVSSKLGSFMDNVDTHLGKLVASESDDMTGKMVDALTQMAGLSSGQLLEAAEILMAEPHKLKVFYHANSELRKEYIFRILLSNKKWSISHVNES